MNLPADVRASIEAELGRPIGAVARVTGGCIHSAARIQAGDQTFFLKHGDNASGAIFEAEADGLSLLAATKTVRTPAVVGCGDRWLLLEWLEPGRPVPSAWQQFGKNLAQLHRYRNQHFGGSKPNFIGSLHQANDWTDAWPDFWMLHRLQPQAERAVERGLLGRTDTVKLRQLFDERHERLEVGQEEGASLLHGDLWSGNAHACSDGIAAVDPSAYYGHREVDLAMAELFGGFPSEFWDGYQSEWPLEGRDFPCRRAIYQLYYLLVHINLFGAGYVAGARAALARALS